MLTRAGLIVACISAFLTAGGLVLLVWFLTNDLNAVLISAFVCLLLWGVGILRGVNKQRKDAGDDFSTEHHRGRGSEYEEEEFNVLTSIISGIFSPYYLLVSGD